MATTTVTLRPSTVVASALFGSASAVIVGGNPSLSDNSDATYCVLRFGEESVTATIPALVPPAGGVLQAIVVSARLESDDSVDPSAYNWDLGENLVAVPRIYVQRGPYGGFYLPGITGPGLDSETVTNADVGQTLAFGSTIEAIEADFVAGTGLLNLSGNPAAATNDGNHDVKVYEAYVGFVYEVPDPEPTGPDTSGLCELGCGEHRLIITDRCGARTICELTNDMSSLEYGRKMDDTSEAKATIALSGGPGSACCECIGATRDWLHAGVIYRNGELVWGPGPVTNVLEQRGSATVTLKDITAWLDRRLVHNDYNFVGVDIIQIAVTLITDAMAPDDPCDIIGNLQVIGVGQPIDFTIQANRTYAGDALRDLARIGLDYTAVGTSILLAPSLSFGPFTTLTDDDFLTDIEVEERGEDAATKWYVAGEAVVGSCGGIDPYYGLLEQVAQEDNVVDVAAAELAACNRLQATNPAPVYVNIPEGAQLAAKAPVCFEQLVPGVLMNVNLTDTCRPVAITNRMTAMKVTAAGGDEQVGVTLSPLGTTAQDTTGGGV